MTKSKFVFRVVPRQTIGFIGLFHALEFLEIRLRAGGSSVWNNRTKQMVYRGAALNDDFDKMFSNGLPGRYADHRK